MTRNRKVINIIIIMVLLCSHISYAAGETDFNIGKTILKSILYLFIFIIFILFTIYGTKFIAKKSKRFINSKYIQIIDKINLDTNTKIIIVEINEYIYILGLNNNTIELIDKVSEDDFNFKDDVNFEKQLKEYENKYINNGFKNKLKEMTKWNKFIGKEDDDDEK